MERFLKLTALVFGFFMAVTLVAHVTEKKFDALRLSAHAGSTDVVSIKERTRQLECLAINIYREAGHEPFEGKVAVAQVTMNRVEHPAFPKDVCGVVYQKTSAVKVVCQFSWYCDSTHRNRPVNPEAYKESYEVAKKVLLEDFRLDILKTALFYHADYVNPNWNLDKIGKIGRHIFYRQKETRV
jgi:spore germination cell wall hydrolase CwlJ-like protein